ncbi:MULTISPECIES: LysR family transcriptional regulator [unclassified Streptomyces]|uniref:LysR family transcriptional regulator n=1 Tax=unclassified Streptomyces TaxID=2593676 RepID=UPI0004CC6AC5|nr:MULTISPECIES: LysR family transcriptional regulator [unclassified Streptomyces]KJY21596.1 LysR family transcriptional regulator [Streptomyces sp. NRRL S-104]
MNPRDVEPRLLRGFVAVAEELHFTRAAARLYVAQQALSRDVRRLEQALAANLFVRTTRAVELTADGHRLLPLARRVLAAHEELAGAFGAGTAAGAAPRPLLVDLNTDGPGTARTVLERARELAPDCELMARFESGLTHAAAEVAAGRLDVAFGYADGLDPVLLAPLAQRPVRYEPLAVLLPEGHALAARESVPLDALAGETVYAGAGNPRTLEWTGLARELFSGRGILMAPPAPVAMGKEEFRRVMVKTGNPVLATVGFLDMPGCVKLPLTDPVPLSPLSMVWRKGFAHPGLDALHAAAAALAAERGWLAPPPGSWLPAPLTHGPGGG